MNKYIFGAIALVIGFGAGYFVFHQSPPLGASTGPDSYFPCESHNGVTTCFFKSKMNTASTTLCSFLMPNATSTLLMAQYQIASTSASAGSIDMGKAATAYATTTLEAPNLALSANLPATVESLRTAAGGNAMTETLAPNSYLNVIAGGAGSLQYGGTCVAEVILAN